MTEKETLFELRKLEVKNGDVILVLMREQVELNDVRESVRAIREELERTGLDKVGFLVCRRASMEVLDEKQLNEAGWYKQTESRGYKYL